MVEYIINYAGNSMFPTLKKGDILRVVPYKDRDISVGDVLVFNSPYGRTPIVHRVVILSHAGVRTKGDNSLAIDDFILQPHEIIGSVVSIQRGKKRVAISGGFRGRIYSMAIGTGKCVDAVLATILRPAYRWFAQTGIFRKLFSRWIHPRVSCFKRGSGVEMQLHLGWRIIGRRFPGQKRWLIRRPFRLFIDESTLPSADDIEGKQMGQGVKGREELK
jgi:signal peptidase I